MTDITVEPDDGSAGWAAEQAAGLIAVAFFRANQQSKKMLRW